MLKQSNWNRRKRKIVENGNEVVNLILNNYGFAGKEFIKIIQNKDDLFNEYNNIVEMLKKTKIHQNKSMQ